MRMSPLDSVTWACAALLALTVFCAPDARAQRADEDAVAEAPDAFGLSVGREIIGLYSAGSARGFSPVSAGNLRIDGLYFDQGGNFYPPSTRIVRSTLVSVGVAAQRYLFAAPTGIVDYQLRVPGDESVASVLLGDATYGEAYDETDVELPLVKDVLSMGAGVGYTRNVAYDLSAHSGELNAGWIARWRPSSRLEIIPFFDMTDHRQQGQMPHIYPDEDGFPRIYSVSPAVLPWAYWNSISSNFGTTARLSFGGHWLLAAGLFRAMQHLPVDYLPFLFDTNSRGEGSYSLNVTPPESSGSTSGEIRLSGAFNTRTLSNMLYLRVTGRNSSIESATGETLTFGPASIWHVPPVIVPSFNPGPISDVVTVHQLTPGVAYSGVWRHQFRLTLGLQKVFYQRSVTSPAEPAASSSNSPWLFNGAATFAATRRLLAYGSFTQGFEEIPVAPDTAINRNEPVPAQLSSQFDAGLTYRAFDRLQLLAGVFQIQKPYFNVDELGIYRELGNWRNRGIELSLTGELTDRLHVVSGVALIQPIVHYQSGALNGPTSAIAVGPVPGYMSTNFEYRPAAIAGLTLGVTVNTTSSRYAVWPDVNLPPFTTLGADVRYQTQLAHHNATFWFRMYNLTDAYGLTPDTSGRLYAPDARRFELSLEIDF